MEIEKTGESLESGIAGKEAGAVTEEKPRKMQVIGTNLEQLRTTITNWLLLVAGFGIFIGLPMTLGTLATEKDWVFYLAIAGLCALGISMLSGLISHISYLGGLSLEKEKSFTWDSSTLYSFLVQVITLGAGIILTVVSIVVFWARYSPSQSW